MKNVACLETLAEECITYQTRTNGELKSETLLCFLHEAIENLGTWENALRLSAWDRRHQRMFMSLGHVPHKPRSL
jgi:hypothetical protein